MTRVCSLDRTGTEEKFYRLKVEAVLDQQARQLLSAQDPGARGRAVVLRSKRDRLAMGTCIRALVTRSPRNVLIVALANKLARIAWADLFKQSELPGCSECHGSITGPHQALPLRSAMDK